MKELFIVALFIALAAGAVTVVKKYNSAIEDNATAQTSLVNAGERVKKAEKRVKDQEELINYADKLAKKDKEKERVQAAAISAMGSAIDVIKKQKPDVMVCESCLVDPDIRRLRRATFGFPAESGFGVPDSIKAGPDGGASAGGRDLRTDPGGSGQGPSSPPVMQSGQSDRPADPGKAKPAASPAAKPTLKQRFDAMMKGTTP